MQELIYIKENNDKEPQNSSIVWRLRGRIKKGFI